MLIVFILHDIVSLCDSCLYKITIEVADITFMRRDLNSVADAIIISRRTMRNPKKKICFLPSFYNTVGIPIVTLGFLALWIAGTVITFSSIFEVTNACIFRK